MQRGRAARGRQRVLDLMPLSKGALESRDLRPLCQPARHQRLAHGLPLLLAHRRECDLYATDGFSIHDTDLARRLRPPLRNLLLVRLAPDDQALQAVVECDLGVEAYFLARLDRRTDTIAHQGRLAARRILDRLVRAGEREKFLGNLLERGALAGANIVKTV